MFEYISQSNTDWEDRNIMCLNASHTDIGERKGGGVCGTHQVRCPPTPRGTPRPVTSSP